VLREAAEGLGSKNPLREVGPLYLATKRRKYICKEMKILDAGGDQKEVVLLKKKKIFNRDTWRLPPSQRGVKEEKAREIY